MRLDYHMHTTFSDGNNDLSEYVAEAIKKGIDEIGFSDHIHLQKENWSMDHAALPSYVSNIDRLDNNSQISVKTGLEVEFIPDKMDGLMRLINRFDFDYLIGSIHHIGDWLVDNEKYIEEWKRRDVDQVYEQYFNLIQNMARTRLFDIVGHLDLVKKFGFRPRRDISGLLLETVEAISKGGMCIEINTGGLRKPCCELYPSERLLKMCFDNGIFVTFGSDAHSPKDVGSDLDKAVESARKAGYVKIVRFSRRKRDFVEI